MNRHLSARGAVLGLILSVAGCGGGGGGGGGDAPALVNPAPSAGASVEIHGVATKGLLKGAGVTAYTLNEQGARTRALATATTDNAGLYTLSVPTEFAGGIVEIVVVADAATAQMECDVVSGCGDIAFGVDASLDETLTMSALVNIIPGQLTRAVNVTPLTNMVAARVHGLGTVNAATLESALSEAKNLFNGADLFSVVAVDLTKPQVYKEDPLAVTAAVVNSALARVAYQRRVSIASVVSLLANSFKDGVFVARNVDVVDGAELALDAWLAAIVEQFRGLKLVDATGVVARLKQLATSLDLPQGLVDPSPSPNLGKSALEKAKAFVAEVRTWYADVLSLADASVASGSTVNKFANDAQLLILDYGEDYGKTFMHAYQLIGEAAESAMSALVQHQGQPGAYDVVLSGGFGGTRVVIGNADSAGHATATVDMSVFNNGDTVTVKFVLPVYGTTVNELVLPFSATIRKTGDVDTDTLVRTGEAAIVYANPIVLNDMTSVTLVENFAEVRLKFDIASSLVGLSSGNGVRAVDLTGRCAADAARSSPTFGDREAIGDVVVTCDGVHIASANGAAKLSVDIAVRRADSTAPSIDWLGASLGFMTHLKGLPNVFVTVNYAGSGLTFDGNGRWFDRAGFLTVGFADRTLGAWVTVEKIDGATSASLKLVNQDGVVCDLRRRGGVITGSLVAADGEVMASITDTGKFYKVSYSDGTFESLN